MKAIRISDTEVALHVTDDEFRILVNGMRELLVSLSKFEFYARVGCTEDEAGTLATNLKTELDNIGIDL